MRDKQINPEDIALLQAYLVEVFSFEEGCRNNFKHTEWYLEQKLGKEKKEQYLDYIINSGAKCDCDVIKKIDLSNGIDSKNVVIHRH